MRPAALAVLLSGTFVQLMSVTVMQLAVPRIRHDLAAGPGAAQLALAGYTLTYACTLITAARLGDRYGYRRLFVLGTGVFTLGSLAATLAPGVEALVLARLVQGIGSGVVAPQILSLIQTAVAPGHRARVLGRYGATMAIASLAGPLCCGVLLHFDPFGLGWRMALGLPVPVGIVALALFRFLPDERGAGASRVDPVGSALSLAGLALLVLPLTLGQEAGWAAWTWCSLAVASGLLAAFALSQKRVRDPLVHPDALSAATTRWGIGAVLLFNAGIPSFSLLLSLHLQGALHLDPLVTAATVAPYAIGGLVGSGLAEAAARRFGAGALAAASGSLAVIALLVVPALAAPAPALWSVLAAGGFAFGLFTASAFSLVLRQVPAHATSSVSGLLPTAQQLGGTFGVALAGMVYAAGAMGAAMVYEAVVFVLAAAATTRCSRPPRMRARPASNACS
ncbi:MFS transporter [Lentzea sp. NPDC058450]|uniref:MFS transporter n=1 Tax=Lentzea sp. NPDC058450 TaxID=3346505 RepID=UPI00364C1035